METLEEAAERNHNEQKLNTYTPYSFNDAFKDGAKWQQERMYTEEDMKQFAFECVANFLSNDDNMVEIKLVEVVIDRVNTKFEKFKNLL